MAGHGFLWRYARLAPAGQAGLFSEEWRQCAVELARLTHQNAQDDPVLVWFGYSVHWLTVDQAVLATTQGMPLLWLSVGDVGRPGLFWDTLLEDARDAGARSRSWEHTYSAVTSDENLRIDSLAMKGIPLPRRHPGNLGSLSFPGPLALCLALLLGEDYDPGLALLTGRREHVQLAAALRRIRNQLEAFDPAHGPLQQERQRLLRAAAAVYRLSTGERLGRWFRDAVG